MQGPQLEDGYTRIANTILEEIARLPINATQFRILMVIWRYTYGFNRKETELSQSFISKATGIHKKQVQRELNMLIKMNIVTVEKEASFSSSRVLKFNKYHQSWEVTNSLPPSKKDAHTGSELVTSPGSELVTQERKNKEIYKERVVVEEWVHNSKNKKEVLSSLYEPDRVPSHCQDDPILKFLNQVSNYYTTLTGRLTSPNDEIAITDISKLTMDFELVKHVMDHSKKNFKPKYSGEKIRSFSFFVPAIKTSIASKEIRKQAQNGIGRNEVHGQGNIDRRTIELLENSKKDWSAAELPEVSF